MMTVETPEHWSGETARFANLVARLRHDDDHRVEEGLLAIATELAELREVMKPEIFTRVVVSTAGGMGGSAIVVARDDEDVQGDLAQTTTGLDEPFDRSQEDLVMEALNALERNQAGLRLVGWYCPGGHPKDREFHDIEETDPVLVEPNVRLTDPCLYAVPMYVLVK